MRLFGARNTSALLVVLA